MAFSVITPASFLVTLALFKNDQGESIMSALKKKIKESEATDNDGARHLVDSTEQGLRHVLNEPRHALIHLYESMLRYEEYWCRMRPMYKSRYPNFLSLAFPKESPLKPFFNYRLLKHVESGTIALLHSRHFAMGFHSCHVQHDQSLGFEKLISVFSILASGFVIAVLLFLWEEVRGMNQAAETMNKVPPTKVMPQDTNKLLENKVNMLLLRYGIPDRIQFYKELEEVVLLKDTTM